MVLSTAFRFTDVCRYGGHRQYFYLTLPQGVYFKMLLVSFFLEFTYG